mmetsp:Transcript_77283/g.167117  ORF Transcript_77283/g.167117 Transcript_77283/m.167117 type:complete len:278 (-) Transcript_77283:6-839(-)
MAILWLSATAASIMGFASTIGSAGGGAGSAESPCAPVSVMFAPAAWAVEFAACAARAPSRPEGLPPAMPAAPAAASRDVTAAAIFSLAVLPNCAPRMSPPMGGGAAAEVAGMVPSALTLVMPCVAPDCCGVQNCMLPPYMVEKAGSQVQQWEPPWYLLMPVPRFRPHCPAKQLTGHSLKQNWQTSVCRFGASSEEFVRTATSDASAPKLLRPAKRRMETLRRRSIAVSVLATFAATRDSLGRLTSFPPCRHRTPGTGGSRRSTEQGLRALENRGASP